jgi:hypothetical protein
MSYGAVGAGGVGAAGTKAKLYALFLVEAVKAEGVVVCFHRIGKGATVCVQENCVTNHGKAAFCRISAMMTPNNQPESHYPTIL